VPLEFQGESLKRIDSIDEGGMILELVPRKTFASP
jgi:hypothetical protein